MILRLIGDLADTSQDEPNHGITENLSHSLRPSLEPMTHNAISPRACEIQDLFWSPQQNVPNLRPSLPKRSMGRPRNLNPKDQILLRGKEAGLTYREIKEQGNFTEAESTLRGRYRILTKEKNHRVRRPQWTDNDVSGLDKLHYSAYTDTPRSNRSSC